MVPDTGQLATMTVDLDEGESWEARFVMIGELARSIDSLDTSALDSEGEKESEPGDLVDPGEIECEFFWDGTQLSPPPGAKGVVTVTLPTSPDQSAPASWTASGYFTSQLIPAAKLNEIMKGKSKFKLNGRPASRGGTPFTFTAATAST